MLGPKTTVVVNPRSQGGKLAKAWPELAETINRSFAFDEAMTQAQGDATRLVRDALASGAERIVAVGGDGTINEVVNGFFDDDGRPLAPNATLGLIPFGTGGDFRRTFDIPTEPADAVALIARNARRKIDVGRLSFITHDGAHAHRMFANIASFGLSGVVDRMVNQSGKKLGRLSFFWAAARATWSYKNRRVALRFDGEDRVEATIQTVAIANGRFFGGAMMVAPNAEPDDGWFDVVALGDFGFGDLMVSGRRIYKGTHLAMDKVTTRRARVVEAEPVDSGDVIELDIDGEAPGRLPARFELVPSALWFVGREG